MKLRGILRTMVWLSVLLGTLLAAEGRLRAYERDGVSLGPRAAYFDPKDADEGTWYGGAQMRFFLSPALALEGSVDYRKDEYGDGAVDIITWPIQASVLFYL